MYEERQLLRISSGGHNSDTKMETEFVKPTKKLGEEEKMLEAI
jgi:hypothetical protein